MLMWRITKYWELIIPSLLALLYLYVFQAKGLECGCRDEMLKKDVKICCNSSNNLTITNPYPSPQVIGKRDIPVTATPNPVPSSKNSSAIALQKCQEYVKYRYEERWTPQLPGHKRRPYKFLVSCQRTAEAYPPAGLTPRKTEEFPHVALIGYGKEFKNVSWDCDGAIISEKFIMSSAHCADNSASGPPQWVLLREVALFSRANDTLTSKVYSIVKIHVHPNYNSSSHQHDISLIELNTTITFNPYLRPACLHTSNNMTGNRLAIFTGWERTGRAEQISDNLFKAILTIVDHKECESSFTGNSNDLTYVYDSKTMICAREKLTSADDNCPSFERSPIKANSGSPIHIANRDLYCVTNIIGIASFGNGICQNYEYPGVYTKVSHYVDWIQSIVWP